jgi:hypothetical protein
MGPSDALRTFSPPFVCLRLAIPPRAPVFVPPVGPDAGPRTWSFRVWQPHANRYRDGAAGPPRFRDDPDARMPGSQTPAGPARLAIATGRRGPPDDKGGGLPTTITISGLNRRASVLTVYASQGGLPHRHARLVSGCRPRSTGWDWLPTGSLRSVSVMLRTSRPPLPSFAWRNCQGLAVPGPVFPPPGPASLPPALPGGRRGPRSSRPGHARRRRRHPMPVTQ